MRGVLHPEVRAFLRCAKTGWRRTISGALHCAAAPAAAGLALPLQCSAAHNPTLQCLCSTAQNSTRQCLCRTVTSSTTHCLCMALPNGAMLCLCAALQDTAMPLRHVALPRFALPLHSLIRLSRAAAILHAYRSGRSPSRRTGACGIHAQGDSGGSASPQPSWGPWSPSVRSDPWRPRLSVQVSFTVLSGVCSIHLSSSLGYRGDL